jgi:hypothetical protein
LPAPYHLLGTRRPSKEFWGLRQLREIGVTRLAELGATDPMCITGWDGLAEPGREVALLQQHLRSIPFHPEPLAGWLTPPVGLQRCRGRPSEIAKICWGKTKTAR